ncbi:flagellar basal body rod protein FlgB [Comamonadaceae bacterium PP-2]
MLEKLTAGLDFQAKALALRAERQTVLASNIANADTPGYQARDMKFSQALQAASQPSSSLRATAPTTPTGSAAGVAAHTRHIPLTLPTLGAGHVSGGDLAYSTHSQPSLDRNTVDLDRERAAFSDNSVRYEAALRFLNGSSKTMLSAITGQ